MKLKNVLLGASMLTVMGIVATSCTNEMVNPLPGGPSANGKSSMLVQAPDIYAWSGQQNLTSTRGFTRAEGDGKGSYTGDIISFEEVWSKDFNKTRALEISNEKLPEGSKNDDLDHVKSDFLFMSNPDDDSEYEEIEMYLVEANSNYGNSPDQHAHIGIFYYDDNNEKHEIEIWDPFERYSQWQKDAAWNDDDKRVSYRGLKITIKKGYKFGFFWGGSYDGENWTYHHTTYYSKSGLNTPVRVKKDGNLLDQTEQDHAGTFIVEGMTFLGLEDYCDFDFQDYVFAFNKPITIVSGDNTKPNVPDEAFDPEGCPNHKCDHPKDKHSSDGSSCEQCGPNEGCNEKPAIEDPCPKDFGEDCGHDGKYHDEDGYCSECNGDNDPCHKPTTPSQPGDENKCPNCPHEKHEGDCPQCNEGTVCHPGDGTGGSDEHPFLHNDEVEVNYSINDVHTDKNGQKYENADLWTKLSIHVRKGTDVKIHVPLPGGYFCESDDFAILQSHKEGFGVYGETEAIRTPDGEIYTHNMTYVINSPEKTWNVTLTVTITDEGMDIETNGIDQYLIDYLFEQNGDGINFEIWNYYQTETVQWIDGKEHGTVTGTLTAEQYEAFQGFLDNSTIEFLRGEAPTYYINAYGYKWANGQHSLEMRDKDCRVTPVESPQYNMYEYYCYHLNGTPWNIIWTINGADTQSECYKAHHMTPEQKELVGAHRTLPENPFNTAE